MHIKATQCGNSFNLINHQAIKECHTSSRNNGLIVSALCFVAFYIILLFLMFCLIKLNYRAQVIGGVSRIVLTSVLSTTKKYSRFFLINFCSR